MAFNDYLDKKELIDIYRTFYPKKAKYTIFSNVHGSFSKIDHMENKKQALKNSKNLKSYQSIFLDKKSFKGEINLKKKTQKHANTWRLNNMLLNNEWALADVAQWIECWPVN